MHQQLFPTRELTEHFHTHDSEFIKESAGIQTRMASNVHKLSENCPETRICGAPGSPSGRRMGWVSSEHCPGPGARVQGVARQLFGSKL